MLIIGLLLKKLIDFGYQITLSKYYGKKDKVLG